MCGRGACMGGGGLCVAGGGGHAWQIPRDTVNERAVCILLECILVHNAIMLIDTSDNASQNQDHWLIRTPYLSIKASNDTPSVSVSMNTRPLETSQCLNLRPIHTDQKRKGEREFSLMFEIFPFAFAFVDCKWTLTAAFLSLSDRASLSMFWYSVSLSSSACVTN